MFEKWIDSHMDGLMADLENLLRIPSVSRGTPEPGKPLGKDVYRALEYAVETAERIGAGKGRILDGYCATVDMGEGDELLMIQCHLDVVPAGAGWDTDPFEPVIRDGRLYARGVLDDKSPAISALYAMAAIRESGLPMKRRVRLFLGGDEEVDWACVNRYRETEEQPTVGFTPDAEYPLVNSEKGICHATYRRPMSDSAVRIDCGLVANVVPEVASAELAFDAVPCEVPEGFSATFSGNTITVHGKGGHAAANDLAKNALLCLLDILSQQPLEGDDLAVATGLHALLGYDLHGEGFSVDLTDESGRTTNSPDILHWNENGVELTMDCRFPFSLPFEKLTEAFDSSLGALGFTREHTKYNPGIFTPADSELVTKLLGVYDRLTGKKSKPLAIGGGTYARGFEHTVAFGIEPEDEISLCHMPNESMSLANIRFNTIVIAEAIRALATK